MIWAIVSYWYCFCWLYIASPSLAEKQIINLTSVLTNLVMSMCKVFSCVVGRRYLLWPVCSLGKILLVFALLHFVFQGQTSLLLQVSLDYVLLLSSPLWRKGHLFLVLVLEDLVGLFIELFSFRFFSITGWGIYLDYCDSEWFALEWNWGHFVVFEIAPKYCILDSFIDYEGYSISSKGFLPTVLDIMVTWIKLAHSHPF